MRSSTNAKHRLPGVACWTLAFALLLLLEAEALSHSAEPLETQCQNGASTMLYQGGRTQGCWLSQPGEVDKAHFHGFPGEVIRVIASGVDYLDLSVVVLDLAENVLDSRSCDGGEAPGEPIPCVIEFDLAPFLIESYYSIEVSDVGGDETGNYTLQIEPIPPECIPVIPPGEGTTPICEVCGPPNKLCWLSARLFNLGSESYWFRQKLEARTDIDQMIFEVASAEMLRIEVSVQGNPLEPKIEVLDPDMNKIGESTCPVDSELDVVCASVDFPAGGGDCSEEAPCRYYARVSDEGHDNWSNEFRYVTNLLRLPEPSANLLTAASLSAILMLARGARKRAQ